MKNPFSGRFASGVRFRFDVRSISHRHLYLPMEMKNLPEIIRLREGESPLSVFKCHDLKSARKAFCKFREKYDFDCWEACNFAFAILMTLPQTVTTFS